MHGITEINSYWYALSKKEYYRLPPPTPHHGNLHSNHPLVILQRMLRGGDVAEERRNKHCSERLET